MSKIGVKYIFPLTLFLGFLISSCGSGFGNRLRPTPTAIGKSNQLVVLCDDVIWESHIGDTLRHYYESPYPILPQPEPNFDLKHLRPEDLIANPVQKELRSFLIIANMKDESSPTTEMVNKDLESAANLLDDRPYGAKSGQNKWADGQILLYLYANDSKELTNAIKESYPSFFALIRKFDEPQIDAKLYLEGQNRIIENKLSLTWNLDIKLPAGWQIAIDEYPFLWLRYELSESSSSLFFYNLNYSDSSTLTHHGLISLRDSITKKYISSSAPGSYMYVNTEDLPSFYYTDAVNGMFSAELRGIWEMENEFMGGPFESRLLLDEKNARIHLMDGFIYAPTKEKRDLMQQLDYILRTASIQN